VHQLGLETIATLVSSPITRFPGGLPGTKVLYVTDDWLAGAPLMGLKPDFVEKNLSANLEEAHLVAAVSPSLAEELDLRRLLGRAATVVIPNGCASPPRSPAGRMRSRTAVLVGQLNERLDIDLLEALLDAGVAMLIIGPRTERDLETRGRLDDLLADGRVSWLGRLPLLETQAHLATAGVGLTPYRNNAFNRASFPLKTLDYLAAGLPVVATDLPAVRWLQTDLVTVASGPEHFVHQVQLNLALGPDPSAEERRKAYAASHSWQSRAAQLLSLLREGGASC
jgi:teichuronic acid biosynthesis glycosyltransferase TuaH